MVLFFVGRLLFRNNLIGPLKGNVDMAADVLLAYQLVEICFLQLGIYFFVYSGKHYVYAFFLAHYAEVGEVVNTS